MSTTKRPLNRRTTSALNAIGQVLMNAGNTGMPRAAIADELGRTRQTLSNLITAYTGEDKCFSTNAHGEPVVNVKYWDETTKQFRDRPLRNGMLARAAAKAASENTITVDPRFKAMLTLVNAALSSINSGEAAQQLVSKLGRLTEPTKEYRAIKAILVAADSIGNLPVDTKGDDLMLKVMKELGVIGNAKDNDSVTI